MDGAKIQLSAKEMELASNADWILTKNGIIEKAKLLFGSLQDKMIGHLHSMPGMLPTEALRISPKVSKGENYNGLPYLILDYPRLFDKQNILAVRTMFWWGNFFSSTLHLGGSYKVQYEQKIINLKDDLAANEFYLCINTDEWEHHFDDSNYQFTGSLSTGLFRSAIIEKPFIKMAKKYPINSWDNAVELLFRDFTIITGMLAG